MTTPTLCPCCGIEMVTKLACPIGCPGPESGTKWKRTSRGEDRVSRQNEAATRVRLEAKVTKLRVQLLAMTNRARTLQEVLGEMYHRDPRLRGSEILAALGEPIP